MGQLMFAFPRCRKYLIATLLGAGLSAAGCSSDDGPNPAPVETSVTAPQEISAPAQAVAGRSVDAEALPYAEIRDELVYGYFAYPSDMIEPLPAIIVVHDWWGLNDNTRAEASRLAAAGYMVLAVDLYGGESVTHVESARTKMIAVVERPDEVARNLEQAIDFVRIAGAPQIATLGWGLGGGWALDAAVMFPGQIDAAVIYYGQVSDNEDKLRAINAPVLGFFGETDRGIKIASVRQFEAAMQRLRKDLSLKIYGGIGHGFADPDRNAYSADIAADAWQRTIEFLGANLSAPAESELP